MTSRYSTYLGSNEARNHSLFQTQNPFDDFDFGHPQSSQLPPVQPRSHNPFANQSYEEALRHSFRQASATDDIPLKSFGPNTRHRPQNSADTHDSDSSRPQKSLATLVTTQEVPQTEDVLPLTSKDRPREKKRPLGSVTPWAVYFFTIVDLAVFIAEIVRNSLLTGIPIQIHPQINPMLGPSYYVLINMGARYLPCMKSAAILGLPTDIQWPCPNSTTNVLTDPENQCTLADLCGFAGSPPPNQWFRFIIPMFLHAGFVHIGFNMLVQLTLGREIEKIIGTIRFTLIYLASGIFGFVLGGNYAASGIVSMGASGSLFGIVAIAFLDLLYTWKEKPSPKTDLAFMIGEILVSFVLGLLPGLDNFSHIGGFLMGLVIGVCVLNSPKAIRRRTDAHRQSITNLMTDSRRVADMRTFANFVKDPITSFQGRKRAWWAWWLLRFAALVGVLVCFVVLLQNFYIYNDTCSWCKYLSCLDVNGWCDVGSLASQTTTTTTNGTSPSRRDLAFGILQL